MTHTNKGNALFLILIAVALFAALSYAVTKSSGGSGSVKNEQASVGASRIMSYAALVDNGAQRLMMTQNVPVEGLRYNNDIAKDGWGIYSNTAMGTPADPSLYLFHPSGGGIPQLSFLDYTSACATCDQSALLPGRFAIRWGNVNGLGTTAPDMMIVVVYLSDEVCRAINRLAGISGIPVVSLAGGYPTYNVVPAAPAYPTGAGAAAITAKADACVRNTATASNTGNVYYHAFSIN